MGYELKGMPILYSEFAREFEKIFYIKDKRKRLKRLLEIENDCSRNSYVKGQVICGVDDDDDDITQIDTGGGLFYGDIYKSTRRRLQLEVKLMDILDNCAMLAKKNADREVEELINARYTWYDDIFSGKYENILFKDEANDWLSDKIQERINELNPNATKELMQQAPNNIEKIQWTAKNNELFTMFLDMLEFDVIRSEKANLARLICSIFIDKDGKDYNFDNVKGYLSKPQRSKNRVDFKEVS